MDMIEVGIHFENLNIGMSPPHRFEKDGAEIGAHASFQHLSAVFGDEHEVVPRVEDGMRAFTEFHSKTSLNPFQGSVDSGHLHPRAEARGFLVRLQKTLPIGRMFYGAERETRTLTALRPPGPKPGASTISPPRRS